MSGALAFRDATEEDLPALVAMLADDEKGALREGDDADPAYAAALASIAADPNQREVVVVRDGDIVGMMQLSFLPGLSHRGAWRMQIEAVRVRSALRGAGIGAAMIRWAIEAARARECALVQLTSHVDRADAHRFYERLGFQRSHAGFKLTLDP